MKLKTEMRGTVEVFFPGGPITAEDGEQLEEAVSNRLSGTNPRFVLGMQEVPYLDSYGLELLLSYSEEMADRGMRLKLAGVTATCREIFDLTEQLDEFEMFDDVEDAVRSFL